MKLKDTYICIDCEELYDRYRLLCLGIRDMSVCPSCTSCSGIPLSKWIKTMVEEDERCTEEACFTK